MNAFSMVRVARLLARLLAQLLVLISFLAVLLTLNPRAHAGSGGNWFQQGPETFRLQNRDGSEAHFKVLKDTPAKQALAVAMIGLINADSATKTKLPEQKYFDLHLQSLTFTPHPKNPDYLQVTLLATGQPILFPKLIKRSDLVTGQAIAYEIPETNQDLLLYTLTSKGHLDLKLNGETLDVSSADGNLKFSSPISGAGSEQVHFSGTGVRSTSTH